MRENLRCLVCGSNRFAAFRNGSSHAYQQHRKPDFYDSTPPKSKTDMPKKKIAFQSDYDLMKANEQFKKLMDEGEESTSADKSEEKEGKAKDDSASDHGEVVVKKEDTNEKEEAKEKKDDPSIEEIAKALKKTKVTAPPTGEAYSKSKSFFDDISCESKEKAEGSYEPRQWQFERVRNQQTFGVAGRENGGPGFNPRKQFVSPMNRGGGGGYYLQLPRRNDKWQQERLRNQQTFGYDDRDRRRSSMPGGGGYYKWQGPRRNSGGFGAYDKESLI